MSLRDFSQSSLVGRLILLAAGWSLAFLVVTLLALTAIFYASAIGRFDGSLADAADGLLAGASIDDQGRLTPPPLTDARSTRAYSGKYWQLAERTGKVELRPLARSRSLWDSDLDGPADPARLSMGSTIFYDSRGPLGEPLRVVAMTRSLPGRTQPVVFMAAEDRTLLDRDVQGFMIRTAILLAVLGAALLAAVILQVRIGLRPVFELRREVADLRKGRAERVVARYPAELEPLAQELNALVAHNQEVIERQRTHVGNLAHALKTPLSVMLAEASVSKGPLADLVGRQAHAMRLQVDHHLRRARAAARAQGSRDRTLIAPALEELARTLEKIFEPRGIVIDWRADDDLAFQGERQDFLEVAGNVLENACKWCRRGVWASAEPVSPEVLRLKVEDDGPGLPEEQRGEVLERGARLDESAPGSGLGLSIVDELVRAYRGTITFGRSAHGGLEVVIDLPRA